MPGGSEFLEESDGALGRTLLVSPIRIVSAVAHGVGHVNGILKSGSTGPSLPNPDVRS
jgi:hypothetical protein